MTNANPKISQCPIRVAMLPWLAYGHITPYLELAKKLSTRGLITYLCSTPATLSCIDKKITEKLSESVKPVPLLLPNLPGLPRELHTTNGLPPHLMPTLKTAFELSASNFSNILSNLKPDLLIYDFLQPWPPLVAQRLNIPSVMFNTSSPTMISFIFHYFKNPSTVDFPFDKIRYRDYEACDMERLLEAAANPEEQHVVFEAFDRSSEIVLMKGFEDIQGKHIDYASSLTGKKFIAIGSLVEEPSLDQKDGEIMSWLDKKEKGSTVFVSFGSEYFPTKEEMDEIAYGLELSKVNFIWVVRFPKGENGKKGLLDNALPLGFLERVGDRAKILEWAPQTRILGHEAIGGFVSHCGWNSLMESMSLGVPIIAVPMQIDQPINARLVEEVGVGVEVLKDENKRIRRDALASVIKKVVIEDCGELVRRRAAEMREKWSKSNNGDEEIEQVVRELVGICNKSSAVKN